jgi:uncharacterized protein (DUF305 family)
VRRGATTLKRMRVRTTRLLVCALAGLILGCGGSKAAAPERTAEPTPTPTQPAVQVVQPGAPGEPSKVIEGTPTPQGDLWVKADADFMRGMIHHHKQALVMTGYVKERTKNRDIRLMSRRMEISQTDEIELMRNWLKERGMDPDEHVEHPEKMPGMLSAKQLEELERARGKRFDELFLRYMIKHHQGALAMVRKLQNEGGAVEPEISTYALHVESDQMIEIEKMTELLKKRGLA